MTTPTQIDSIAPVVANTDEWLQEIERLSQKTTPSFFHLTAPLPERGRTNQVLGATPHLNVVLKTYASGGENELHAHVNEDHLFLILQGRAAFFGPNNEQRDVGKNDCVLLPRGSFYRFRAFEDEPLVMLRIGAVSDPDTDILERIGVNRLPLDGFSKENKEVPVVLSGKWFE